MLCYWYDIMIEYIYALGGVSVHVNKVQDGPSFRAIPAIAES
jgi:hypothetical protein